MATTIVNPPPPPENTTDGLGYLGGIIFLAVIIILFVIYGLPYLRTLNNQGIQVNLPKTVNVNVKQTK